jgi:membrane-bound serine protease (ClpP class)
MTDPDVEVLEVEIEGKRRFVRRSVLEGAAPPEKETVVTETEGVEISVRKAGAEEGADYTYQGKPVKVVRVDLPRGKLLTMTADEAHGKYGFIDGVVEDREGLLKEIGYAGARTAVTDVSWPQEIGRFLAGPLVSGLLVSLAMLGLMMEVFSPGKGVGGLIFLFSIGLFFWAHALAGEAGALEIVIFLMGVVLLALEAFVIPGFGVAGISGIGLIVLGLVLSFIPEGAFAPAVEGEGLPFPWDRLGQGLSAVLGALAVAAIGTVVMARYLPSVPLFRKLVLAGPAPGEGSISAVPGVDYSGLVGSTGTAETDLRPVGKVEIAGELYDAVTQAEFLERGEAVVVAEAGGNRLVVARAGGARSKEGGEA